MLFQIVVLTLGIALCIAEDMVEEEYTPHQFCIHLCNDSLRRCIRSKCKGMTDSRVERAECIHIFDDCVENCEAWKVLHPTVH